jgi:hypothetical protein
MEATRAASLLHGESNTRKGLLALKCEMPQCYHHKGRGAFDPVTTPRTKWAPSPDHYPILTSAGGHHHLEIGTRTR